MDAIVKSSPAELPMVTLSIPGALTRRMRLWPDTWRRLWAV